MRGAFLISLALLVGACAAPRTRQQGEVAPYKAVVVFEWLGEGTESPEPNRSVNLAHNPVGAEDPGTESGGDTSIPFSRERVEDEILLGLDDYQVFSEWVPGTWETMHHVAQEEKADLILLVRIGSLAEWEEEGVITTVGLLNSFLWLTTAFGGWWAADLEYSAHSDVEVAWKRAPDPSETPQLLPKPQTVEAIQGEFSFREPLSDTVCSLSFWERAKPWKAPLAYLMNVFIPPPLVPHKDPEDVQRAVTLYALEDLKRELAAKLKGGYLRSDAPFRFQLVAPRNGAAVEGNRVNLRYRYAVEPGFDVHKIHGLSAVSIDLKAGGEDEYRRVRRYEDEAVQSINRKIRSNAPVEEQIDGLRPGVNLIRFEAHTAVGDERVTNTIAFRVP